VRADVVSFVDRWVQVTRRLADRHYASADAFVKDVHLTFDNAMKYNSIGSQVQSRSVLRA
jgi:hypothetical protein